MAKKSVRKCKSRSENEGLGYRALILFSFDRQRIS